ncbi:MAG: hypothetical protein ABWZ27_07640 [Aestuariivirgaceae bacterium]
MSIRKLAILAGTIGLLSSPAFAQSTQDSNTYPESIPDTPQAGNLAGQQDDLDVTGPTGAILEPGPAPDALDMPGYDPEGGPYDEMPPGIGEEPPGPGPNDQ